MIKIQKKKKKPFPHSPLNFYTPLRNQDMKHFVSLVVPRQILSLNYMMEQEGSCSCWRTYPYCGSEYQWQGGLYVVQTNSGGGGPGFSSSFLSASIKLTRSAWPTLFLSRLVSLTGSTSTPVTSIWLLSSPFNEADSTPTKKKKKKEAYNQNNKFPKVYYPNNWLISTCFYQYLRNRLQFARPWFGTCRHS